MRNYQDEEATEGRLQQECFMWAHNRYPETRQLLCYNLNNSKNKIDGNLNRAKGLIKGRSDFTFYWNRTAYFIELKTTTGTQSPEQKEFERIVTSAGFRYYLIRTLKEFQTLIETLIPNREIEITTKTDTKKKLL